VAEIELIVKRDGREYRTTVTMDESKTVANDPRYAKIGLLYGYENRAREAMYRIISMMGKDDPLFSLGTEP
jgi:hypothetical protein